MRTDDPTAAIARIFADPTAAFTIDEIAARFDMTLGEVIRRSPTASSSGSTTSAYQGRLRSWRADRSTPG